MQVKNNIKDFKSNKPTAVTIGKFDGMHRGHGVLIEKIVGMAKEGFYPVVLTFDMSPRIVLGKEKSESRFLFTKKERSLIMEERGVELLLEIPFTKETIETEPEDFIRFLVDKINMRYLCVGSDFRFGHKGRGDADLLVKLSKEMGYEVDIVDKVTSTDGKIISSTIIRECINSGEIEIANDKLGYEFFLLGDITHGNRIGRTLGMPTINIRPDALKLLVPGGVYISHTTIGGVSFPGVTNVGIRPTIKEDKKELLTETHLLDFDEDVYGDHAKVSFVKFLREEKKFDSLTELKHQIDLDVRATREYFRTLQ